MPLVATGFDISAVADVSRSLARLSRWRGVVGSFLLHPLLGVGSMARIPRSQPHPRNFRTGQELAICQLAIRFSTLRDLGSLIGGPGCCCVACSVSTDLALFCTGAIGLLGIAAGCRLSSSVESVSAHDSHSS